MQRKFFFKLIDVKKENFFILAEIIFGVMQKEQHQRALEIFEIMFENNLVTAYAGPFDNEILTLLAENLEATLWERESLRRRFFKIFVELAQNIALHSEERMVTPEKTMGEGIFIISNYENYFLFIAGNIVGEDAKNLLAERANSLNYKDRNGLREMRRDLRNTENAKGGGNIGLVQVALLSKNPFQIDFLPTDEEGKYFYLVSVKMEKG